MAAIDTPELSPASRPTLLHVANVIDNAPAYVLSVDHKYETFITDPTLNPIPAAGQDKQFEDRDGIDHTTLVRFGAYRGLTDQLMRGGPGYSQSELERLFEAGEPLFVEQEVQSRLLSPKAVDITPTPGTAVTDLRAALGLLQQWMAGQYAFEPVITGNVLAVSLIKDLKAPDLRTITGTRIGVAAGYGTDGPGAAVAAGTEAWLYISGQINIWRGKALAPGAQDLQANRDLNLVEKRYAASVDGPVAAILVGF